MAEEKAAQPTLQEVDWQRMMTNWASMLLELLKATGNKKMRQRAMQTVNYVTYYLQPDKPIVVGFSWNQWWYSGHTGVICYLLDFAEKQP